MLHTVHREVRLAGGPNLCSGRVEVFHGKTWSTVCDADFDQMDAEVVCRDLGCGLPVEVLRAAAFGRGEGQVWSEELQCRGNESQIHFCPTSSSLKHNCSHGHTQARLVNGSDSCSGRVELQYLSEWGTVCDVSWDMRAASVLCGQLKCGSAVAVLGSDWFGEGSGRIWADVFDCQGNETHLSKCPISSWSRTACSHQQDAGVICSGSSLAFHEGRVRLSGGMECEGEVEVYFRQDWRRVLLDSWSESEASVVCRQLGCGSVISFSSSSTSSPEHKHMCMTGFNCSGSEAHLRNCSSTETVNCSSREQLSVTCSCKCYSSEFYRIASNDNKPRFSSGGDADPHHHTASTKRCYSIGAGISTAFVAFSPHFASTIQLLEAESGLITEHNIPLHVQVPLHMLPTPAQTGLTVKGSHGRPPGSPMRLEIGSCSLF
ncbi:hypothetical protein MHYP_G00319380 [Metynnis hypsauchen]